jgi:hypothetical protein
MQRFRPKSMMMLGTLEGSLQASLDYDSANYGLITDTTRELIKTVCERLERDLSHLGLVSSFATVERMRELGTRDDATYTELARLFNELHGRLKDETKAIVFLSIDPAKNRLYLETNLFGETVAERLPAAIGDIEEAGKCLALDRGTACVFHLMRVMEVGLRRLANDLGISYAPSWESYINQINDRIATKHKRKGITWKRDEHYFKEIAGDLLTVKVAWRNPTMHIVRTYTPDEAEQIFAAVRTLMQRIAGRTEARKTVSQTTAGRLRLRGTGTVTPPES